MLLALTENTMPIARKYAGPYEYFSHKVRIGKPDECWEWKDGCGKNGYGIWQYSFDEYPRVGNAHKRSYILFKEDPKDKLVLHKCGNRKCCNPDHLYLGDNSRNMKDAVLHGTHKCNGAFKKGSNHANNKLSEEDVEQIRILLTEGVPQREIAKKYNVSRGAVQCIKNKRSWSWLK